MVWASRSAGLFVLLWPVLLLAQVSVPVNPPTGGPPDASALPNAPSASISMPIERTQPPSSTSTTDDQQTVAGQSWWLAVPQNGPYRPLTPREKFHSFLHYAYSPYTFAGAAYDATWAQAWGDPHAYGGGMEGWGKRMGAAAAGSEARSFFGTFLFPTLLRQDPRYFAMYKGPVVKRGLHALSRVFVTRADDGSTAFNSSGLMSIAFTESLCMAWTPEGKRSAGRAFTGMLGSMQADATSYLLREFTPDLLRLFKRHAPRRLQRLEEKLPAQMLGVPPE